MEQDLCGARLGGIQTGGARIVRILKADVGVECGGDHVPVADQPTRSAVMDPVGEGFGDAFSTEAGLGQLCGEGGSSQHPTAGLLALPGYGGDESAGCGGLEGFAPPAVPGADVTVLDDQVRTVAGDDTFGYAPGAVVFGRGRGRGGVGEPGPVEPVAGRQGVAPKGLLGRTGFVR
jgi:hypothetical protein